VRVFAHVYRDIVEDVISAFFRKDTPPLGTRIGSRKGEGT